MKLTMTKNEAIKKLKYFSEYKNFEIEIIDKL